MFLDADNNHISEKNLTQETTTFWLSPGAINLKEIDQVTFDLNNNIWLKNIYWEIIALHFAAFWVKIKSNFKLYNFLEAQVT